MIGKSVSFISTDKEKAMRNIEARSKSQISPGIGASHFAKHKLATPHIQLTFDEITSDRIARLTGLVSHFVYWCVFGHVN